MGRNKKIESTFLSERLTSLRKEKKLTQEELAKNIGITRQSLSHYENGSAEPPPIVVYNLAKFFQVSSDYLLGLSTAKIKDSDIENACDVTGLSEKIIKLLHEYNEVEKSGQPTEIRYNKESGNDICMYLLKGFNKVIEENEELAESFVDIIISLSSLYFDSRHSAEYFIKKIESGEKIEFLMDREHAENVMNLEFPRIKKNEIRRKFEKFIRYFYNAQHGKIYLLATDDLKSKNVLYRNYKSLEIDKNSPEFLEIKQMFKK